MFLNISSFMCNFVCVYSLCYSFRQICRKHRIWHYLWPMAIIIYVKIIHVWHYLCSFNVLLFQTNLLHTLHWKAASFTCDLIFVPTFEIFLILTIMLHTWLHVRYLTPFSASIKMSNLNGINQIVKNFTLVFFTSQRKFPPSAPVFKTINLTETDW